MVDRTLTTSFGYEVRFNPSSTLVFYDGEEEVLSLDPTDLSNIYGAYRQMIEEKREKEAE